MFGLALCAIAMLSAILCGRRSLANGLIVVLGWGYAYGIIRANLASISSYFIFDAAVIGLYLSQFIVTGRRQVRQPATALQYWAITLMIWPIVIVLLPFQPLEISLVGLRGSIFFLPMMLLAMRLRDEELSRLALGMALLDIASLSVALAEYFYGIESFYPNNEVTQLIYDMNDVVAGSNVYRIPSTFSQAHGYAGTMLGTIPFLYGGWAIPKTRVRDRLVLFAGLVAALFGILLAASRSAFLLTALAATFITFSSSTNKNVRRVWICLLACIAAVTLNDVRLQRFTTLRNADYVEGRIAGSVNRTFFEILLEYPMGNGLGGGGTSIPYFWQGRVRQPIGLESEYCRILVEQSIIGLMLWISFILWLASSSKASVPTRWRDGRRLACFISLAGFCTAMIGTGMFTAVPQTLLFFLNVGWFSTLPASGVSVVISRSHATYRVSGLAVKGEHE